MSVLEVAREGAKLVLLLLVMLVVFVGLSAVVPGCGQSVTAPAPTSTDAPASTASPAPASTPTPAADAGSHDLRFGPDGYVRMTNGTDHEQLYCAAGFGVLPGGSQSADTFVGKVDGTVQPGDYVEGRVPVSVDCRYEHVQVDATRDPRCAEFKLGGFLGSKLYRNPRFGKCPTPTPPPCHDVGQVTVLADTHVSGTYAYEVRTDRGKVVWSGTLARGGVEMFEYPLSGERLYLWLRLSPGRWEHDSPGVVAECPDLGASWNERLKFGCRRECGQ